VGGAKKEKKLLNRRIDSIGKRSRAKNRLQNSKKYRGIRSRSSGLSGVTLRQRGIWFLFVNLLGEVFSDGKTHLKRKGQ